jgi:hypothetical protein
MQDFKLGLEDQDIDNIFKSFDVNGDGVLDLKEFMDMILGDLSLSRQQAVEQAYQKLDSVGRGSVPYTTIKQQFDGTKHPDVGNGKRTAEEVISDFLEIYEVHHNTFNDYKKVDYVTKAEFFEFYRTLGCNFDDDASFAVMVKGVWGVKQEFQDVSQKGWAGGQDASLNSRDRYQKANAKGTPFGTSTTDSSN